MLQLQFSAARGATCLRVRTPTVALQQSANVALWTRRTRGVKACAATAVGQAADGDEDDNDDGEAPVVGRLLRVERLLANLGYGKRRECQMLVKKGRVRTRDGGKLKVGDKVCWGDVVLDDEELDPPSPLLVAIHKPTGYVVTSPDDENITDPVVYDLLPYRFGRRRPFLSSVGRLDKDTSGLLLLTDDGTLLHRINSPKKGIWKVYEATLADAMTAKQATAAARKFASGTLVLEGDFTPLLPAKMELTGERTARMAICEGRYHQVRRMFAAVGNKVVALHRVSVGALTLGSLPESEWRYLTPQDLDLLFEGPTAEDMFGPGGSSAPALGGPAGAGGSSPRDAGSSGSGSGGAAAERDGGSSASGSTGGSTGGGSIKDEGRLTKKEKKKGKKEVVREAQRARRGDADEEDEDEDVADFELLPYDEDSLGSQQPEDGEDGGRAGAGQGRRPRRPPRPPTVRQGAVVDRREDSLDEQQDAAGYGIAYDDDAADMVLSAGAGGGVRKYRDGDRWRRRRDALKQMLPSSPS